MKPTGKAHRLANLFYHYARGHSVLPYPPIRLWVESSNRCNLKCIVCPNATDTTSLRGEMEMELYRSILAQNRWSLNDMNLSHRGEPLYHPQLEDMIRLAGSEGIGTRIHSNATLLDPDRGRSILDAAPDLLSFSFDGYDKETYESIRRGGIFEQTIDNIESFLKLKTEKKRSKPYSILQIIQPEHSDELYFERLEAFGAHLRSLGLDKFYIKKPHNWGGNTGGELNQKVGFVPCTFIYYSMTILWDGTVCPCPQDWYASMKMGDIRRQSMSEIWNGEPMVTLRRRMQNRDLEGLLCHNCDRVFRPAFMGIPTENIKAFLGETLAGYSLVRKLIRK